MSIQLMYPVSVYSGKAFDVDTGPLAVPSHLKIGMTLDDGRVVMHYGIQYSEYGKWLNQQIEDLNEVVCSKLEEIYQASLDGPVVLMSRYNSLNHITHASQIKEVIERLAG